MKPDSLLKLLQIDQLRRQEAVLRRKNYAGVVAAGNQAAGNTANTKAAKSKRNKVPNPNTIPLVPKMPFKQSKTKKKKKISAAPAAEIVRQQVGKADGRKKVLPDISPPVMRNQLLAIAKAAGDAEKAGREGRRVHGHAPRHSLPSPLPPSLTTRTAMTLPATPCLTLSLPMSIRSV